MSWNRRKALYGRMQSKNELEVNIQRVDSLTAKQIVSARCATLLQPKCLDSWSHTNHRPPSISHDVFPVSKWRLIRPNLGIPTMTSHSVLQLLRECLLRQCAQPATADYALQGSPSSDEGWNTKAKLWLVNFQVFAIYGDWGLWAQWNIMRRDFL